MASCTLCDLPTDTGVSDEDIDGEFCCRGCLEVYRTLGDVETENIAADDLRAESTTDTTGSSTDAAGEGETAYLSVDGMHCKTCEAFIEATATEKEGITAAQASYATDMVRLTYDSDIIEQSAVSEAISTFGYHATEPIEEDSASTDRVEFSRLRTVFGIFAAMTVMAFYILYLYPTYLGIYSQNFLYNSDVAIIVFVPITFFSTIVLFGVGFPLLRGAYVSLRARQPNMDVLIALAVLVAYLYSVIAVFVLDRREVYFDVSTMVIIVVSIGNYIEDRVKQRVLGIRSKLTESRVPDARLLAPDGTTDTVEIEECEPGDHVLVKPGERIPVDGDIVDGTAAVDESLITGESIPETKTVGDTVVGGSIVTDSAIVIEVNEDATSTLDRLVELLWTIQSSDAGTQRLVNRIATIFVPLVVVLAVATTLFWLVASGSIEKALLIGVSVLVISCPCSLGVATPLAIVSGLRAAADRQIILLNTTILEQISETEIVAFDKTGTLTTGQMTVEDVIGDDSDALLRRAAAVEARSNHPIATAITDAADPSDAAVADFEQHKRGVSATVNEERVTVGHPNVFDTADWTIPSSVSKAIRDASQNGMLPTVVGWDGVAHGVITVGDSPREGWDAVVSQIAENDCRVVVITGDDRSMARRFTEHPDIEDVFTGVPPEAKEAVIGRLQSEGTVTMVGDGTNDAPALASADLGVALASGTDVSMDAADAVVTADRLDPIPMVFDIARATRRRIRQNLGWAFCYNLVAIPLAMAGLINPLIAAGAMAMSSIIVVTNSARKLISRSNDTEDTRNRPVSRSQLNQHSEGTDV
jgi:Cu2+-exporting ATPase